MKATFWLLQAPDSLSQQSRREPDGTGLGVFDAAGKPLISKQPLAAFEDQEFAREAKAVSARTFVAHVRYASTGGLTAENTHPFEQDGRLFAHNGVIGDLQVLEHELGADLRLVQGATDSERFFALITREIGAPGMWPRESRPRRAGSPRTCRCSLINFVLITPETVGAALSRRPELFVLERAAGGPMVADMLSTPSAANRIRVTSDDLGRRTGGGSRHRADGRRLPAGARLVPASSCTSSAGELRADPPRARCAPARRSAQRCRCAPHLPRGG